MQAERARLRRLLRLEQVRAQARQQAAREAAAAETALAQLETLADRTRTMLAGATPPPGEVTGATLRQLGQFSAGLAALARSAGEDLAGARRHADHLQQALARAERRRAAVADRAALAARLLAERARTPVLGSRRASGTELE